MVTDVFLKVLSDLCLYFAVVGSFPKLFVREIIFLVPALLCALGAALASLLREKGLWRFAALLIPAAAYLLVTTLLEALLLAPAMLYVFLLIYNGAYSLEYYDYRDSYLNLLKLLGFFILMVFAMGYFEGMFGQIWDTYDVTVTLFYSAVFGFSGVFLLRQLRLGADSLRRDRIRNTVEMIVVLGLILALSAAVVAAEKLIHDVISWISFAIMAVVGFLPMVLHEIIQWFLRDAGQAYLETMNSTRPPLTQPIFESFPTGNGAPAPAPEDPGFPWLAAVVILAVLTVALVYLMKTMHRGSRYAEYEADTEIVAGQRKAAVQSRRSSRSRLRKVYRNYLRQQRKRGVRLEPQLTSRDILNRADAQTDQEAAAELRSLYLKARYADHRTVSRSDVEQARRALQRAHK